SHDVYPTWPPATGPTGFNVAKLVTPGNGELNGAPWSMGPAVVAVSTWPQLYPALTPTYAPVQGSKTGTAGGAACADPRPTQNAVPASTASLIRCMTPPAPPQSRFSQDHDGSKRGLRDEPK